MKIYTPKELKVMPLRDAQVEISNAVYASAGLFEQLEDAGKILGNGHHMMQRVAKYAEDLMEERWINEKEAKCMERKKKNA